MAINEQCLKCSGFNSTMNLCTVNWVQPSFDGNTCGEFKDKQSIEYTEASKEIEDDKSNLKAQINQVANHRINKRGSLHLNKSVSKERENNIEDKGNNTNESKFVIDILETFFGGGYRILRILLLTIVIISTIYGVYAFVKYNERQDREELVWKARIELEAIRDTKIIEYLKLYKIDYNYDDALLTLSFLRNYSKFNVINQISDSVMSKEIASLVAIYPNKWDTICCYLNKAEVDLKIVYSDVSMEPSICMRYSDLSKQLLSDKAKKEGKVKFEILKGKEVLGYALQHFRSDRFFKVIGMDLEKENYYLNLLYDDNKAKLGKSFLDTTEVNMHFRDPVGDMGSILDGMLAICSRTNRGFGFIFKGYKNHQIDSVVWPVEKMRKIAEDNISYPLESRKTNQVSTVIIRTTKRSQE